VSSPEYRDALERMRGFNWVVILPRACETPVAVIIGKFKERTHDIVVKMLTGGLFRDYDERHHVHSICGSAGRGECDQDMVANRKMPGDFANRSIGQERGDDYLTGCVGWWRRAVMTTSAACTESAWEWEWPSGCPLSGEETKVW